MLNFPVLLERLSHLVHRGVLNSFSTYVITVVTYVGRCRPLKCAEEQLAQPQTHIPGRDGERCPAKYRTYEDANSLRRLAFRKPECKIT